MILRGVISRAAAAQEFEKCIKLQKELDLIDSGGVCQKPTTTPKREITFKFSARFDTMPTPPLSESKRSPVEKKYEINNNNRKGTNGSKSRRLTAPVAHPLTLSTSKVKNDTKRKSNSSNVIQIRVPTCATPADKCTDLAETELDLLDGLFDDCFSSFGIGNDGGAANADDAARSAAAAAEASTNAVLHDALNFAIFHSAVKKEPDSTASDNGLNPESMNLIETANVPASASDCAHVGPDHRKSASQIRTSDSSRKAIMNAMSWGVSNDLVNFSELLGIGNQTLSHRNTTGRSMYINSQVQEPQIVNVHTPHQVQRASGKDSYGLL